MAFVGSLDVTPIPARQNLSDSPTGHAILFSNGNLRSSSGALCFEFPHLLLGELGAPAFAPFATAPLGSHICHVVCVGAKKHMRGIAASAVIAMMANEHSFRDRPVGEFVGEAMCHDNLESMEHPVTARQPICGPRPTSVNSARTIHFRPKTFGKSASWLGAMAPQIPRGSRVASAGCNYLPAPTSAWYRGTIRGIMVLHGEAPFAVPSLGC